MNTLKKSYSSVTEYLYADILKRDVILLPLRLFIGLGWLRSGVEKMIDPAWQSRAGLLDFFAEQIGAGHVVFPFYLTLMEGPFTEYAGVMTSLIVVGELLVGLGLLVGLFTRPALIAGLFMNLNFVLAGSVNPSAFYIIIQLVLINSTSGQVLGIDGLIHQWVDLSFDDEPKLLPARFKQIGCFMAAGLSSLLAFATLPFIQTFDPAESIDDVAMLLTILLGFCAVQLVILGIRFYETVEVEEKEILRRARSRNDAHVRPVQTEIQTVWGQPLLKVPPS